MFMKKIALLAVATVMTVSIVACGGEKDTNKETEVTTTNEVSVEITTEKETETTSDVANSKVKYTVTVLDAEGNPLKSVMVQLCKDSCVPAVTNESGVAEFELDEADYKVSIITMPEGYVYSTDETEFYFESGSKEMTIVLNKQ